MSLQNTVRYIDFGMVWYGLIVGQYLSCVDGRMLSAFNIGYGKLLIEVQPWKQRNVESLAG